MQTKLKLNISISIGIDIQLNSAWTWKGVHIEQQKCHKVKKYLEKRGKREKNEGEDLNVCPFQL